MDTTTIGIFKTQNDASKAIEEARTLGINDVDISYIYDTEQGAVTEGGGTRAGEGAAAGVSTGAILGGLAGLAVAAGVLPGLGALLVAGPLAGALGLTGAVATTAAGALTGAAAGGIIGALVGLGVKEEEAKIYEERVKLGGILVAIRNREGFDLTDVFSRNGAEEVRTYSV